MTVQVVFFDVFFEKDRHLNAVEENLGAYIFSF